MRAAKVHAATGEIVGVREGDVLPDLPDGLVYHPLEADEACDPDLHRIVDGVIVAKLAISVDTLARWRAARKAEARAVRQAAEDGLCQTPLGVIQTPLASRLNIAGLVSLATIAMASGTAFEQPFRMADNGMVPHDADQIIALGVAVGRHVAACAAAYFAIADAINASDDPASIDIAGGYPTITQGDGL